MSTKQRVLLVEDDLRLASLTQSYLEQHDYSVQTVHSGADVQPSCQRAEYDLILLDLNLPEKDGLQVCKELKALSTTPVIMLTARDNLMDELVGLEAGADDYLKKPVEPSLLLARMKAVLRRNSHTNTTAAANQLEFGHLTLNLNSRDVKLSGEIVELGRLEFDLLSTLCQSPDMILSRNTLSLRTRGIEYDGADRTIDIRISKLRRKLGDNDKAPELIKTIWGKGYLFCSDSWLPSSE